MELEKVTARGRGLDPTMTSVTNFWAARGNLHQRPWAGNVTCSRCDCAPARDSRLSLPGEAVLKEHCCGEKGLHLPQLLFGLRDEKEEEDKQED